MVKSRNRKHTYDIQQDGRRKGHWTPAHPQNGENSHVHEKKWNGPDPIHLFALHIQHQLAFGPTVKPGQPYLSQKRE
jgi:hypothetical protein